MAGRQQGGLWRGSRAWVKALGSNTQNAKWVPKQSTGYRLSEAINVNYRYRGPEREELVRDLSTLFTFSLSRGLARC